MFLCLLALLPLLGMGQTEVRIGSHRFVPDQNVQVRTRGGIALPEAVRGSRNVLVQLGGAPSSSERAALARQGVSLGDYLGGNAYWALLGEDVAVSALRGRSDVRSVMAVAPEWKLSDAVAEWAVPSWARSGRLGEGELYLRYAENASEELVLSDLRAHGVEVLRSSAVFRMVEFSSDHSSVLAIARDLPYVQAIGFVAPPAEAINVGGAELSRGNALRVAQNLGGRGLTGKGVCVGVWDAQVVEHPDFGERVKVMERSAPSAHGTHVTGTVLGSGFVNPRGRGVATGAQAWTWCFGPSAKTTEQEMAEARDEFKITLTQNSYGYPLRSYCDQYSAFVYEPAYQNQDKLTLKNPTLLHVFAAGNDKSACEDRVKEKYGEATYGTIVSRAKNVLYVGSVNQSSEESSFSSMGPQSDGRLAPHVCAKGHNVFSTMPGGGYADMSGTSMATPQVTGHLALVSELYAKLNGGEIRADLLKALAMNTASDKGTPGPDFTYGYGILNAEKMAIALEEKYYDVSKNLSNTGDKQVHTIPVPGGVKEARVMVVWNDAVVDKVYALDDKLLVQDLDLVVKAGGKDYLPWVLDHTKDNVSKQAERKVDNLNNQEQVTLSADELKGVSELEVTVTATKIPSGEQAYALVWWFEKDASTSAMRWLTPNGPASFQSGEMVRLAVENGKGKFSAFITYDGGTRWHDLILDNNSNKGEFKGDPFEGIDFRMPDNMPISSSMKIQLRFEEGGRIVTSPTAMTVGEFPTGLQLEGHGGCERANWTITWTPKPLVTNDVAVLIGDATTAQFRRVATVKKGTNTYTITAENVKDVKTPYVAIAYAIGEESYGRMSPVFRLPYAEAIALSSGEKYLFEHHLFPAPSKYFIPKLGENVSGDYVSNKIDDAPVGANLYILGIVRDGAGFNKTDYFASENASNLGKLEFCELDLSSVSTEHPAYLRISAELVTGRDGGAASQFRVLDGPAGTPLKTILGKDFYSTADGVKRDRHGRQNFYFALPSGRKIQPVLEFASPDAKAALALEAIRIIPTDDKQDVGVSLVSTPVAKRGMTSGDVTVRVYNRTKNETKNLPVIFRLDGQEVKRETVASIKAFDEVDVQVNIDFTTARPNGQFFKLEVEAVLAGDANPEDNKATGEVFNPGKLIIMPHPTNFDAVKPWGSDDVTVGASDVLTFTDGGGVDRPYRTGELSFIHFKSGMPGKKVQIVLESLEFAIGGNENEGLQIFLDGPPPFGQPFNQQAQQTLKASISGPVTYVSRAVDGDVTVRFYGEKAAAGWVAKVSLVDPVNTLKLLSVEAKRVNDSKAFSEVFKGKFEIQNLSDQKLEKVRLTVHVKGEPARERRVYEDITLDPKQTKTFEYEVLGEDALEAYKYRDMVATLKHDTDSDVGDNTKEFRVLRDRFCIPKVTWNGQYVKKLSYGSDSFELEKNSDTLPKYHYSNLFLIADDKQVDLTFTFAKPVSEGEVLFVYIEGPEGSGSPNSPFLDGLEIPLDVGKQEVTWKFDFSKLDAYSSMPPRRVRLVMGSKDEVNATTKCPLAVNGSVQDIGLLITANNYFETTIYLHGKPKLVEPTSGFDLGTRDVVMDLSLKNYTRSPFRGELYARLTVKHKPVGGRGFTPIQTYDFVVDLSTDELYLPVSYNPVTRRATVKGVDLSKLGEYEFQVEIFSDAHRTTTTKWGNAMDCDLQIENKMPSEEFVGLRLVTPEVVKTSSDYARLYVDAGAIKKMNAATETTLEVWVRPHKAQYGAIFMGKRLMVFTTYNMPNGMPDNAVGVILNSNKYHQWTDANTIVPGAWNHIAVTFKNMSPFVNSINHGLGEATIYINGKKMHTKSDNNSSAANFEGLCLGTQELQDFNHLPPTMEADFRNFRMWEKALTEEEIAKNMNKFKLESADHAGCVAEVLLNDGNGSERTTSIVGGGTYDVHKGAKITSYYDVWVRIDRLIGDVVFFDQVDEGGYDARTKTLHVKFLHTADLSKVQGIIVPLWPSVNLTYDGKAIDKSTVFDLSNGKKVEIVAKGNVLGKDLTDTLRITGENEASNECDIVSITLTDGDDKTQVVDKPGDLVRITLDKLPADMKKVELTFTISEGAKLYVNSVEVRGNPLKSTFDFSDNKRVEVVVKAANNRDSRRYVISLRQTPKPLVWNLAQTTYTYGDGPVTLTNDQFVNYTLDQLSFRSNDFEVARVVSGKLEFGKQGTAEVTAFVTEDPEVKKMVSITVNRKSITAKLAAKIERGVPFAWVFEYTGLVKEADKTGIDEEELSTRYAVKQNGETVNVTNLIPEKVGVTYQYELIESASYENDWYSITLETGEFTVFQGSMYLLTVTVLGPDGQPMQGATVDAGVDPYRSLNTDGDGKVSLFVKGDSKVTVKALKDGYESVSQEVTMPSEDHALSLNLKDLPKFTYTYTAGANGKVNGQMEVTGQVVKGGNAPVVKAEADEGYEFKKWSDGKTVNPRHDQNVQDNITVTAEFVTKGTSGKERFTLTYRAGANGTVNGQSVVEMQVATGDAGNIVTAEAAEGYVFEKWSDGEIANPRQDKNVQRNIDVEAIFRGNTVVVKYVAGEGGKIEGNGEQHVSPGSSTEAVRAVANAGYEFTGWSDGKKDNPRTDVAGTTSVTYTAQFRRLPKVVDAVSLVPVSVKVYPNPTDGAVRVRSDVAVDRVVVYTALGQVVEDLAVNAAECVVSLSGQPSGVYYLRVVIGADSGVYRVLKR